MRIFITGIAGFLGSHLAEYLLREGHEVVGCDNLLGGYKDNVPSGVEFHTSDARDFDRMCHRLRGAEIVYHLAASPHEGLSVFSPNAITSHTYNSTVAVVSAAVAAGVRRVVFCSSMARYGRQDGRGGEFTEEMEPQPVDPYGIAKVASEMFLRSMAEAHELEFMIAVPHNIYGPRQKYDDPYRNVLAIMANRMLQGKQPFIYGDGEQRRCFSYIDDAVEPLAKLGLEGGMDGEVVNVGPDENFVTINEAAHVVARVVGFDEKPIYLPPRPQEVPLAGCSADKARQLLGYRTTVWLDEGVERLVGWVETRGPRPFDYYMDLELVTDNIPVTWKDRLM